jgi:hypothetical protein
MRSRALSIFSAVLIMDFLNQVNGRIRQRFRPCGVKANADAPAHYYFCDNYNGKYSDV